MYEELNAPHLCVVILPVPAVHCVPVPAEDVPVVGEHGAPLLGHGAREAAGPRHGARAQPEGGGHGGATKFDIT